jgi:aminoglycoside/choline kinase family phosphotransferase
MSTDRLKHLFEQHFHASPASVIPLRAGLGGSERKLFRLIGNGQSAVGIEYNGHEENQAFLAYSRHFRRYGLPVPEIYGEDLAQDVYLEEDLGDTTLFEFLAGNRDADNIAPQALDAYRKAIAVLPRFQVEAGRTLDYSIAYPRAAFDRQSIAWDMNYFKYYFLRLGGITFNEQALEDDFGRLAQFLLEAGHDYFLYRDFQSRNIMLRAGEPWFLDYQGGRRGALQYDIASLLFDAKADLPPSVRGPLLDYYLEQLARYVTVDRQAFLRHYYAYVCVRIMQALGAYGFRGFYERKPVFLQSVPYALKNVRWLLHNVELPIALPTLMATFRQMLASDKLMAVAIPEPPELTVRVYSFSFHRGGPPQDGSGNGGGFVFDARSLPNPGREERFKALTGADAPVIAYLRQHASVEHYLASVRSLLDAAVENYRSRGFRNLMVSFGCTGGQHRSVYLANQLAEHLRAQGVRVELRHLEQEKTSQ